MIKRLALPLFSASAVLASSQRAGDPRILGLLDSPYLDVCQSIAQAISSASAVYYPGSISYTQDIKHWASSSSDTSACSVRPGTAADVGVVLQIVGETETPFAVKGGGHATNPGFSSTPGVHISMANFDRVNYSVASSTVEIGSGLVWDDVYEALEPFNVNVVGGRVTGVGVAGFTLGGGYSWLSNQYGLTVDNVVNFELVLPNGTVTNVNAQSDSELFFGLKGGFNNYGIVTRFTMKAHPQGECWGGLINVGSLVFDQVINATATFSATNTDPKAAVIITLNTVVTSVVGSIASLLLFYDGPNPPAGIFDEFLAIPFVTKDIKTRSFISVVQSSPSDATAGTRQLFNTAPSTDYSRDYLKAVANESLYWGGVLTLAGATFTSYDIEPFLPSALSFGGASGSAYPPTRNTLFLPTNILYSWALPTSDDIMKDAARKSRQALEDKATALGQDLSGASVYGNYALAGTSLEDIYGDNLPRLRALKTRVDPNNVMGLAGGWKFA